MSDSIYREYGLHKGVSTELIDKLTKKFRTSVPDSKKRQGVFLGVEFLRELVADLDNGKVDGISVKFDGIVVNYGVKGTGKSRTFELVATQLVLEGGDSTTIVQKGINYASTPVDGTNPPDVGSPPIGGVA